MTRPGFHHVGLRIFAIVLLIVLASACTVSNSNSSSKSTTSAATSASAATGAVAATSPSPTAATSSTSATVTSPSATLPASAETPVAGSNGATSAGSGGNSASNAPAPLASNFASAIRAVVDKVKPAVVQITNEQTQPGQFNQQPYTVPAGVGSGIIYDNQGHILTNNHVVEGASKLLVSLPDGRSFPAKLVGADPLTDLAVVQISGDNLPVAQLGDSTQLQVGDWVVAIGNALALEGGPTVTEGVVSALNRTVQEPGNQQGTQGPFLFDVIQTNAAINPGNSGGPLVNLAGQVVGINTLVAGMAEPGVPAQGIGFAIAISTVKPIADQLVSTGKATHPFVGVSYLPLNASIAAQLGINTKEGVLVQQVQSGSPADSAGVKAKDIIAQVDGKPLPNESSFAQAIEQHKPGETVTLTVIRDGQTMQIPVKLGERPQGT